MKKRSVKAITAAMLSGCLAAVPAVPAAAEESAGVQDMQALAEEMQEIEQALIEGNMQIDAEGAEILIQFTAQKYETSLSGVNINVKISVPDEMDLEIPVEDVARVTPEGFFLNTGAVLTAATELVGEDMNEMAAVFGIDSDWVGFMASDFPSLPKEEIEALGKDIEDKTAGCMDAISVSKVENGYQAVYTAGEYQAVLSAMKGAADENLESWLAAGIDILGKIDIAPFIDAYAAPIQEGISSADESFDADSFTELAEELKTFFAELAATLDAEELAASIRSEDVSEELSELEEIEEMNLEGSVTLTKDAEGVFEMTVVQNAEEEGTAVTVSSSWKVTPSETEAAEAPDSYTDSREVVRAAAPLVYQLIFSAVEEGDWGEEYGSDWGEYDDTLLTDGNRFCMSDYWDEISYWVTYDETVLELDTDWSSCYSVYLNIPDSYDSFLLSLDNSVDFAGYCAQQEEWYKDNEEYGMTEPVQIEGTPEISYVVMEYKYSDDEYVYRRILFGSDLSESSCLYGELDIDEDTAAEDMIPYIRAAVIGLEPAEAE